MIIKNVKSYKISYHSPKWKVDAFVVENQVTNHLSVDKHIKIPREDSEWSIRQCLDGGDRREWLRLFEGTRESVAGPGSFL